MRTLARLRAHSFLFPLAVLILTCGSPGNAGLFAQAAAAKPASAEGSSGSGFSIETEMLTYRALEANGEAIACDVASYLEGVKTDFTTGSKGAICNVPSVNGNSTVGVVVLPFDRAVFSDFTIWRSDMQTMAEFEARGASACSATPAPAAADASQPEKPRGRGLTATATGVAGAMTPAGQMLATGSGVLGLFAKTQAAEPTGGTIQDQAFMDNVSRELRAINVTVMMPDVYTSYQMTSIDPAKSPFLISLDKLMHIRDCLVADKTTEDQDVKNIDDFLASLTASPSAQSASPKSSAPSAATSPSPATTATAATPAPPAQSRLESALTADGLAQRLGADPATGKIPDNSPHHLLFIKALESGGSVNKNSNIFGTKMSYSGGSVGTYALFNLNGDLECSGNVYDYTGSVASKDFDKQLRAYVPDPGNQVIFQRGSCAAHP